MATLPAALLLPGTVLEIIYQSESGAFTQRKIQVICTDSDRIRAICFLRQTKRTFKLDNILSVRPAAGSSFKKIK
ncbi:hypothetical protein [Bacillus massiliglaciei]|uniref:hypothetical protein n=1 Tax=Bacillus massiliglaciei TaxID=1816693 RepID=UPI000DA63FFF|nr:hypothetical protein [Bacillus massiliglaciei]